MERLVTPLSLFPSRCFASGMGGGGRGFGGEAESLADAGFDFDGVERL